MLRRHDATPGPRPSPPDAGARPKYPLRILAICDNLPTLRRGIASMTAITKRLERAIQAASAMPADPQDVLAAELLDMNHDPSQPPYKLTQEERAELDGALAEAARGDFAGDEDVTAMWRRHEQ